LYLKFEVIKLKKSLFPYLFPKNGAKLRNCFYICTNFHLKKSKIMAKSKFLQEFKDFAMKGNVVDMAVGVVIGGAFGKIVSSLVGDVIMPAIGALMGGLDFTSLRWVIREAYTTEGGKEIAEAALSYGNFIQTLVDFIIIALSIFLVIKGINKMSEKANAKKKAAEEAAAAAAPAPEPTKEEVLLGEIRDLLKKQAEK
jgi:large conductance mechanosensitive channel protein